MKNKLLLLALIFPLVLMAQKNSYFGSSIIPKGDYLVKQIKLQKYWSSSKGSPCVVMTRNNSSTLNVINFIPAGNGYYFIKFKDSGLYLTNGNNGLCVEKPLRKDEQKFKVVDIGDGKFKFVSSGSLAVSTVSIIKTPKPGEVTANSLGAGANSREVLKTSKFNNNNTQIFEIIDANIMKPWKGE